MNSLILDLSTAFPSANLEYGVIPAPFNCSSYLFFVADLSLRKEIALPSPNCPAKIQIAILHSIVPKGSPHLPFFVPAKQPVACNGLPELFRLLFPMSYPKISECDRAHAKEFGSCAVSGRTHVNNAPLTTRVRCLALGSCEKLPELGISRPEVKKK